MKKIYLTIICCFGLLSLQAQICTGTTALTTQAEVDNFVATHAGTGCNTINGSLTIGVNFGNTTDITDISGLSFIENISGSLTINNASNLSSLNGLTNLSTISNSLTIFNCDQLVTVDLSGITSNEFQYVNISSNALLQSISLGSAPISVLYNLDIKFNPNLSSIQLTIIQGDNVSVGEITIQNNGLLTTLDFLNATPSIGKDINIIDNNSLVNIDGLAQLSSARDILIESNDALTQFEDNFQLQNISSMIIQNNSNLVSIGNFGNNLIASNSILIRENQNLTDISGLQNLVRVRYGINISLNPNLDECCVMDQLYRRNVVTEGNASIVVFNNGANCNTAAILNGCGEDGIIANDNCQDLSNPDQTDTDNDGIGDPCDNCPSVANNNQLDSDDNGIGDACQAEAGADTGFVGISTNNPLAKFHVEDGDVFISNINRGIIMKTASGKCFRYKPNEQGMLVGQEIICP